jgi:hypothetical protein
MIDAPSASELAQMPEVMQALEQAWIDSEPGNRSKRHEEGGWIYWDQSTNAIMILRAARGMKSRIDLETPPVFKHKMVIAKFHTHPNPSSEGWDTGPSQSDMIYDEEDGVPDLIRADDGLHFSGPDRRRGGLNGNPGYPN